MSNAKMHWFVWSILQLRPTQMNKSEHKTASWCRPIQERAAKALTEDQPNPVVMDSVGTGPRYAYKTQNAIEPTIGAAPAAFFDDKKSSNEKKPDSLVIGIDNIIPRWHNTPPIQLLYFVRNDTFVRAVTLMMLPLLSAGCRGVEQAQSWGHHHFHKRSGASQLLSTMEAG